MTEKWGENNIYPSVSRSGPPSSEERIIALEKEIIALKEDISLIFQQLSILMEVQPTSPPSPALDSENSNQEKNDDN